MEADPRAGRAPRVIGLIASDPRAYAGAHGAIVVEYDAPRGERISPRKWLEMAAVMEGRSTSHARALADATLKRIALPAAPTMLMQLQPAHRAAFAMAEAAIAVACEAERACVVVPAPPLDFPARDDLRRIALGLFAGADVVLHALEAWELATPLPIESIVDATGRALAPAPGARSIVARVFGEGAPYAAFREALEQLAVVVDGGPIAHLLTAPDGVGPRDILAAAHAAGLDVLEVRDVFDRP